jgi:hypothetical protein
MATHGAATHKLCDPWIKKSGYTFGDTAMHHWLVLKLAEH